MSNHPATAQASTLHVASITIHGTVERDMYDDHPGLASFSVQSSRDVNLTAPLPLRDAIRIALSAWTQLIRQNEEASSIEHDNDRTFSPSHIVLRNQVGHVVQQFDGRTWLTDAVLPTEWTAWLERADAWDMEACDEERWDNIDSGRRLRDAAERLRLSVVIAQAHTR